MTKTTWSYVLAVCAFAAIFGAAPNVKEQSSALILFGAPAGFLYIKGKEEDERIKKLATLVHQLHDEGKPMATRDLSQQAKIPQIEIRKLLTMAEKRSLIPYGLEIK